MMFYDNMDIFTIFSGILDVRGIRLCPVGNGFYNTMYIRYTSIYLKNVIQT